MTEIHNLYYTVLGSCQKVTNIDSEVTDRLRQLTVEYNFSDIESRKDFKTATENLIKINAMYDHLYVLFKTKQGKMVCKTTGF